MRQKALLRRRNLLGGLGVGALAVVACRGGSEPHSPPQAQRTLQPLGATTSPAAASPAAQAGEVRITTVAGSQTPDFSNVAERGPDEAALFFAGKLPGYPSASAANFLGYSPADILESMDTVVVDQVGTQYGDRGLQTIYGIVAKNLLETLLAVYGTQPVVLALDAGHGGLPEVYFEPGSNGTEWRHTRAVVDVVESIAGDSRYASISIRRIFNDFIGDDFGLPPPQDSKPRASLVLRNARASMLSYEAGVWNHEHPDKPVAVHVVSVHFNANSGGTLVLHQGDDVPADFAKLSLAYAHDYVDHARPALNVMGLLPSPLGLVNGNGLHDDSLMYAPPIRNGPRVNPLTGNVPHGPPRYAMLQASLLEEDYVQGLLHYRGLA